MTFNATALTQDAAGLLWLGTVVDGLFVFDPRAEAFIAHYPHDPGNPHSPSNAPAIQLYRSSEDMLWVGMGFGGIDYLDLWQTQFTFYRRNPTSPNSFLARPLRAVAQDATGFVWVGTAHYLTRFDPVQGVFQHYNPYPRPRPPASPQAIDIAAIYPDEQGGIWFDGVDGMYRFDIYQETFQSYRPTDREATASFIIWAMEEDREKNFWAVDDNALYRFDRVSQQFTAFRHDPDNPTSLGRADLRAVSVDHRGDIWIGGVGFLSYLNRLTGQFQNYYATPANPNALPPGTVQAIHEDRRGTLWLATTVGLTRFERQTKTFTHYTEAQGLPSNLVQCLLEDQQGHLWLSTARGLSRFNPQTGVFRNYTAADGLRDHAFNASACSVSPTGQMFFAGENGLTTFFPDRIMDRPSRPKVVLTDFRLFNQPVSVGADALLRVPIWETEAIALRYDQNIVSFEFAALSYAAPEHHRYRYILGALSTPGTRWAATVVLLPIRACHQDSTRSASRAATLTGCGASTRLPYTSR